MNEANQDLCPFLHDTQVEPLAPSLTTHEEVEGVVSSCHGEVVGPRDLDHHVGNKGPCEEEDRVVHVPCPIVVEVVVARGA